MWDAHDFSAVRVFGMLTRIAVHLGPIDRKRLQVIDDDRNSPKKHAWRAKIVLTTANGWARRRSCVWPASARGPFGAGRRGPWRPNYSTTPC